MANIVLCYKTLSSMFYPGVHVPASIDTNIFLKLMLVTIINRMINGMHNWMD